MEETQVSGLSARLHAWRSDRRFVAALCGCIALAAAFAWWRAGASGASVAAKPVPSPSVESYAPSTSSTTVASRLVVDVVGAVRNPGVVHIAAGARVLDAITAAGGATGVADLARLNLAAPVTDGSRIAVPQAGQPAPPLDPGAVSGAGAANGDSNGAASGPVNINTATASELDALPGIGPATAQAIVSDRDAHGPFASVDDLARVRGIGPAKLSQLRPLVTT